MIIESYLRAAAISMILIGMMMILAVCITIVFIRKQMQKPFTAEK